MESWLRKLVLFSCPFLVLLLVGVATVLADPCLVVYPGGVCDYHYESAEYYTVGPGDPLYDPAYDRGGEVLIDINDNEIAYDIYDAPNIARFILDEDNQGYFTIGNVFDLIVDGFSNSPTTFVNVLIVFDQFEPSFCTPLILIDGAPALFDPGLGWYYPIGDLVVSTPDGSHYSDTETFSISWEGCSGLRAWAFSDENFNLNRDGGECKVAFSHDVVIPVYDKTWGSVKDMYSIER